LALTYDLFFNSKEGFEEHIQVSAEEPAALLEGRTALIEALLADGASPRAPKSGSFNKPTSTQAPIIDPMLAAAAKTFGAEVSAECPTGCGPMRRVKGTNETGKLSKAGKPYPSFYACNTCGFKQNA